MRAAFISSLVCLVGMVVVAHGQFPQGQLCQYLAQSCSNQFRSALTNVEQNASVEEGCQVAASARRCMGSCLSTVAQSNRMVRAMLRVLDYVCEEDRRQEVEEVAQARCFHDGSIESRFRAEAEQCSTDMMATMQNRVMQAMMAGNRDINSMMCPVIDEILTCVDGKVEEMCGPEVVPFVNDIIRIVLREMLIERLPTCFDQVEAVHSVMKRAVDYVKMLRK